MIKIIGLIKKNVDKEIGIIFALSLLFFYKLFLSPTKMIYPAGDIPGIYYYWRTFLINGVLNLHTIPLWDPYVFSGTTFIGDAESAIFSPFTLFYFIFPVYFAFGFAFFIDTFLVGLFTYLYAKLIELPRFSALISSACMMFGGYFIILIYPGHVFIVDTIVWFPLLLYFYELAIRKNKLIYGVLAGLPLGALSVAGHIQPGLYGFTAALIYLILRLIFDRNFMKNKKLLLVPFIAAVVGFCLFAIELLPIVQLAELSKRAGGLPYSYASDFSLPIKQLISFIFPNFFGNPINLDYWGKGNFWSLCGYVGIIPLFFAGLAILKKKNNYVWIFVLLGLFALIFSLGKYGPIFPFFYSYIPLFNLFRVPSRFLYIYGFSLSILAGIGAEIFIDSFKKNQKKLIIYGKLLLLVAFFCFIITYIFSILPSRILIFEKFISPSVYGIGISRQTMLNEIIIDLYVLTFTLVFFGLTLIFSSNLKSSKILKGLLLILIISNLWFYWIRYYGTENLDKIFSEPSVIKTIKEDNSTFRVFDQSGRLVSLLPTYNIESITGSKAISLNNFKDFLWLIGDHVDLRYDNFVDIRNIKNTNILSLLNVKYITSINPIKNNDLKLLVKTNPYYLYILQKQLPRAYIVPNSIFARDDRETLDILKRGQLDFKKTVILKSNEHTDNNCQPYEAIDPYSHNSDQILIKPFLSKCGFLVLSEIWYPGWKAYDNGKQVQILKADGILRAVKLNPGKHNIIFKYDPDYFRYGEYLSLITLIGLIILICFKRKSF